MKTMNELFERAARMPTFEQVFGVKGERLPKVCCVTGERFRKGDNWTRHALGNGYSVFAKTKLTPERLAALTALLPSTPAKAAKVKDADNG